MRLRIESADGSLVNDYRILRDHALQVRSLDPRGNPIPGKLGKWKRLSENDLGIHRALGTPVATWMKLRLG